MFNVGFLFLQLLSKILQNIYAIISDVIQDMSWLQASWQKKQLRTFQSSWCQLPVYQSSLVCLEVDLSGNSLSSIPEILLWGLPQLRILNLSHNKLQALPGPLNAERLQKSW